jgi:hypothetical protein
MLRLVTPTGSIEAMPEDEKRVRGLSDLALCTTLNQAPASDLFAVAEGLQRPTIRFSPAFGWYPVQEIHS